MSVAFSEREFRADLFGAKRLERVYETFWTGDRALEHPSNKGADDFPLEALEQIDARGVVINGLVGNLRAKAFEILGLLYPSKNPRLNDFGKDIGMYSNRDGSVEFSVTGCFSVDSISNILSEEYPNYGEVESILSDVRLGLVKSLTITLLLARCESLAECEELLDSLREAYPCFDKQFMDLSVFEILINKAANWKERVSFLKEAVRTEAHDFYNITEFLAEKCNSYEEFEFVAQLLAEDPLLKEKVLARGDFFIAWMSKFPDRAKDIYLVATEKFGLGRNSYLFICMKGFVSMEDFFYFLMATEKSGQVSHYIEKPFILGSIQFWSAEKGFLYLNWIAKHGGVVDAEIIKAFSDKFKLADFSKYMSKIVKLSETFYPAVLYPLFHAGVKAALKESGAGGVVDMLKLFIENDLDFDLTGILDSFFLEENLTQINEIQSKVEAEFSSEDGVCDNKFLVQMNEWIETKKAYAESRFDEYFARCESVGGVIQGVGKMFKERVTPDEAIVNALDLVVMDPMFREQLRQRLILFFEPVLKGDVESLQDLYFDEILGLNNEVSLGAEEEVIDFDGWVKLYGITMPANRRGEEICAILDRQWVDVENHEGDITVLDCFDEYLKSMKRPAVMRVKAHMEFLFKTVETPRA